MLYEQNDTMRMLGCHAPSCLDNKDFNDVLNAYENHPVDVCTFVDFYNLGRINGIREERERRNHSKIVM